MCFSWFGPGALVRKKGNLNATTYNSIFNNNVLPQQFGYLSLVWKNLTQPHLISESWPQPLGEIEMQTAGQALVGVQIENSPALKNVVGGVLVRRSKSTARFKSWRLLRCQNTAMKEGAAFIPALLLSVWMLPYCPDICTQPHYCFWMGANICS